MRYYAYNRRDFARFFRLYQSRARYLFQRLLTLKTRRRAANGALFSSHNSVGRSDEARPALAERQSENRLKRIEE